MLLPELKQLAASLGVKGTGTMRKGQLVDAVRTAQGRTGESQAGQGRTGQDRSNAQSAAEQNDPRVENAPAQPALVRADSAPVRTEDPGHDGGAGSGRTDAARDLDRERDTPAPQRVDGRLEGNGRDNDARDGEARNGEAPRGTAQRRDGDQNRNDQNRSGEQTRTDQNRPGEQNRNGEQTRTSEQNRSYDDDGTGRRGRRRRNRDRQNRRTRTGAPERFGDSEPVVGEDDVLVPTSGILDVLDNYAFVRTSGYLPGSDDAYVSLAMVKKYGLRKGDVVTGLIRASHDGERKEKFNPLVRIDTVNGGDPDDARNRPDFAKLTPLYPQDRLKLETTPNNMIGRIVDLVSPVGKGQRGLIVSPAKAGKTMIMQSIANAISANNPEVHLMIVLVAERPEEVTDFQRTTQGEVIASTFDRPAEDHTLISELAIERAKRLVELGHDVVILLDGITRLGRAYNLAAPASGRILSGGVDSAALYPPKRFFGAARNIEGGGSLTILATALIETGSKMDEVIFEEFKGTGNMELRLRRDLAEKRIFPAIDVDASSTRREELLMGREELAIVWRLRRLLSGMEGQQGLELLLDRLKKTASNGEFLMVIQRTTPSRGED